MMAVNTFLKPLNPNLDGEVRRRSSDALDDDSNLFFEQSERENYDRVGNGLSSPDK